MGIHVSAGAIIERQEYKQDQYFNMEVTGFFWKEMYFKIYIMKNKDRCSGFKAQKDRVTLIMHRNAGGFTMKQGFIYMSTPPEDFKRKGSMNTGCMLSGCTTPRLE